MFIQARALTSIYMKGVASLGSSATRWTVSVAYPTQPCSNILQKWLLGLTSAGTGLHINNGKTKITRMQHTSNSPVTIAGQPLEEVSSFTCLESVVDTQGGTHAGVRVKIGKAKTAFLILTNVWSSKEKIHQVVGILHQREINTPPWIRNMENDSGNTP